MGSPVGRLFSCQRNSESASSSARDAVLDVNAVDAEIGQLAKDLRLRLAVLAERHAVEVRGAVDDVDAQRRGMDVPLHAVVELRPASARSRDDRAGRGRSDGGLTSPFSSATGSRRCSSIIGVSSRTRCGSLGEQLPGLARDAHDRRIPEAVAQRRQRLQDRGELSRRSARRARAAVPRPADVGHELAAAEAARAPAGRTPAAEVPERLFGGAADPVRCLSTCAATSAAARRSDPRDCGRLRGRPARRSPAARAEPSS